MIIERTLEFGTIKELRWLFTTYTKAEIAEFVKKHGYRKLSPKSFTFWKHLLKIGKHHKPPWLRDKVSLWRF